MTVQNLDYLFKPKSVALIGASKTPSSVGAVLARNLFKAGFDGPVMPVNPKYQAIEGVLTYPDIASRHCHVNRRRPQRTASMPFQVAALALSHTLNASVRNRLNVDLLSK